MDLARGALVHGDQAGVRPRPRRKLGGQSGDARIEQPVQARRRDLGRVRERGGEEVAVGGEVDAVESRGAHEPPVKERRRVGYPGERAAERGGQRVARPQHLGQDRAGDPE